MIAADWTRLSNFPMGSDPIPRRSVFRRAGVGAIALGLGRHEPWLADRGPAPRSLIVLTMVGGASPWETFDPKPDAPSQLRGPFGSIATAVPGVRVTEHLPKVARRLDHLSLIRSVHHDADPTHDAGLRLLATGQSSPGAPSLGSVAAQQFGSTGGIPPFVVLPDRVGRLGGSTRFDEETGPLGPAFEPFIVGCSAASTRFQPGRVRDRARAWVDVAAGRGLTNSDGLTDGRGWDWAAERPRVRASFGESDFGRDCWLAGRLVAAGSRVVVVNMARSVFHQPSWDGHGRRPFSTFDDYARHLLPAFDQGFTGLVDHLAARGRLDSTLVVAVGEFGRTPWINESGGRDHWPGVWSALVAGGGTVGGRVVGSSDLDGRPRDRPVALADLVATMGHALGLTALPGPALVAPARPVFELFG